MAGVVLQISVFVIVSEELKISRWKLVAFELAFGTCMDYRDPRNEYADPRDVQRQSGERRPSLYMRKLHKES